MKKSKKMLACIIGLFFLSLNSVHAEESFDVNAWRIENRDKFDDFRKEGIPKEKIYSLGEECISSSLNVGITVTAYEYRNNINEIDADYFFSYDDVLNACDHDGKLKAYSRKKILIGKYTGEILEELETAHVEQEFLIISVAVHNYNSEKTEVPVYGTLEYIEKTEEGIITWADPQIVYLPMDESDILLNGDGWNIGNSCNPDIITWTVMEGGAKQEFDIVFIVDSDRKKEFLVEFGAIYNDLLNGEKNVQGYFQLD